MAKNNQPNNGTKNNKSANNSRPATTPQSDKQKSIEQSKTNQEKKESSSSKDKESSQKPDNGTKKSSTKKTQNTGNKKSTNSSQNPQQPKDNSSRKEPDGEKSSATNVKKQSGSRPKPASPSSLLKNQAILPGIYRVSDRELLAILRIDGKQLSSNVEKFCSLNITLYDFAITAWEHLIVDSLKSATAMSAMSCTFNLVKLIIQHGLIEMIKQASAISDSLIACNCDLSLLFIEVDRKLYDSNKQLLAWKELVGIVRECRTAKEALQVLRFLKRFSPRETDLLSASNVNELLVVEKNCDYYNRKMFGLPKVDETTNSPKTTETAIQRRIRRMVGLKRNPEMTPFIKRVLDRAAFEVSLILSDFWDIYTECDGYFSNGSINDGNRAPAAKLRAAICKGVGFLPNASLEQDATRLCSAPKEPHYTYECEYHDVAKNYKSRRGTAQGEAGRNFHAQRCRLALRECLRRNGVDLDDQGINQHMALKASVLKILATIDLTGASDHIPYGLVRYLMKLNLDIFVLLRKLRDKFVIINKKKYRIAKFAMSGNPLCFEVESLVFIALLRAIEWVVEPWLEDSQVAFAKEGKNINTYGDDMIAPSYLMDTISDVFTALGFELNMDKTHWAEADPYRESCGEEYVNGEEISSKYFPRKLMEFLSSTQQTVAKKPETIVALLSMQHRFYKKDIVNRYLIDVIRTFVPDMTESYPESDFIDIWSEAPVLDLVEPRIEDKPKLIKKPNYQRQLEKHYVLTQKPIKRTGTEKGQQSLLEDLANILALQDALIPRNPAETITSVYGTVEIYERRNSIPALAGNVESALVKKEY